MRSADDLRRRLPAEVRQRQFREAALHLIAERGIAGLTVRQICREIGLSTGAFFHYFESKGAFLEYLFLDEPAFLFDEVEPYVRDSRTLRELHEGVLAWLGDRLPYVRDYTLAFFNWMALRGRDGIAEAIDRELAGFLPRFAKYYADLQRRGVVRGDVDPEDLAAMVAALIDDLAFMFFFREDGKHVERERFLEPFRRMLNLVERLAEAPPGR